MLASQAQATTQSNVYILEPQILGKTLNHLLHTRTHWGLSPYPFPSTHRAHFCLITAIGPLQEALQFFFLIPKGLSIFSVKKATLLLPVSFYCLFDSLNPFSNTHTICYFSIWLSLSSGCRCSLSQLSHDHLKTGSLTHHSSKSAFPSSTAHYSMSTCQASDNFSPRTVLRSDVRSHFLIPLNLIFLHHQVFWSYMP